MVRNTGPRYTGRTQPLGYDTTIMGHQRFSQKDHAVRATIEDFRDAHGVDLEDAELAVLQSLTLTQLEAIRLWVSRAWSDGFQRGERQPSVCGLPHVKFPVKDGE